MRTNGGERHVASAALIALRETIGITQEGFAALLGKTVTTVARYETSHPPAKLALLELAAVAYQQSEALPDKSRALLLLRETFISLHERDAMQRADAQLRKALPSSESSTGVLLVHSHNPRSRQAVESFKIVMDALDSPHPARKEAGLRALSALRRAAKECR